jgi:hypothetical protein
MYCSLDHAQGKRLFVSPLFRDKVRRRVARVISRGEWSAIDAAIMDYLQACMRAPGHKLPQASQTKGQPSRRSASSPLCWVLVDFLSRGDVTRIESAWNTPYATARCLFDACRDMAGEDDTLESAEEERRFDQWAERSKGAA